MNFREMEKGPLISVIIPCYNQGRFLAAAIQSVLKQEDVHKEIIVINDGSKDHTEEVVSTFEGIHYIKQENKGMSAARNLGLKYAKGEFILFLDADDILLDWSLRKQLNYMLRFPEAAFVSGGHSKSDIQLNILTHHASSVQEDHYLNLLRHNYVGLSASVLYRRNVFDHYSFDPLLKGMEDYDLLLKISRDHFVLHHTDVVAVHRQHRQCISANLSHMFQTTLMVLGRQRKNLRNKAERSAYQEGIQAWIDHYCDAMIYQLRKSSVNKGVPFKKEYLEIIKKYRPKWYWQYQLAQMPMLARIFGIDEP